MELEAGFFEAFATISPWAVVAVAGALLAGVIVLVSELGHHSLEEQVTAPRNSGLRHAIVNLVGLAVVLAGATVLVSTNPLAVDTSAAECESASGSECRGEVCCADATACFTSKSLCEAMVCANYPGACGGGGPSAPGGPN